MLIKLQVALSKHLPDAQFILQILVHEVCTVSGYASVFGCSCYAEKKIN